MMLVGFQNTCTASGKSNVARVIPRLYRWVCKTGKLLPLADEHSVAAMTAGSQSRQPQIVSYGGPILDFRFINLCSESMGAYNFEIIAEDSYTGGPSSFTFQF